MRNQSSSAPDPGDVCSKGGDISIAPVVPPNFNDLVATAVDATEIEKLRYFGLHKKRKHKRGLLQKPGPKTSVVRIKLYHLPGASSKPRFTNPHCPIVKQHFRNEYGYAKPCYDIQKGKIKKISISINLSERQFNTLLHELFPKLSEEFGVFKISHGGLFSKVDIKTPSDIKTKNFTGTLVLANVNEYPAHTIFRDECKSVTTMNARTPLKAICTLTSPNCSRTVSVPSSNVAIHSHVTVTRSGGLNAVCSTVSNTIGSLASTPAGLKVRSSLGRIVPAASIRICSQAETILPPLSLVGQVQAPMIPNSQPDFIDLTSSSAGSPITNIVSFSEATLPSLLSTASVTGLDFPTVHHQLDDVDFYKLDPITNASSSSPINFNNTVTLPSTAIPELITSTSSHLIGSSKEREELRGEMDATYTASLNIDKQKEERKRAEKESAEAKERQELEYLVHLQETRSSQVPPEPTCDEYVVISVRHVTLGIQRRKFSLESRFHSVYNWVGSLSQLPMHFQLYKTPNIQISYYEEVEDYAFCVLGMLEVQEDESQAAMAIDGYAYADGEADASTKDVEVVVDVIPPIEDCRCNLVALLSSAKDKVDQLEYSGPVIILHRRPSHFWQVLFRQNVNLMESRRVIWAGEPSADEGGPYREFLLTAMAQISLLTSMFFGNKEYLFFQSSPKDVLTRKYFLLGQLCAMAIIYIGRGPQAFSRSVVNYMFTGCVDNICDVEDGHLSAVLEKIANGDTSPLIDANIIPEEDLERNKQLYRQYYCVISQSAGIEQFKCGVKSVAPCLLENRCCIQKFFLKDERQVGYQEVRNVLRFNRSPEGSNQHTKEENAITEFELFLVSLDQNSEGLSLAHFLRFVAAVDRIPVMGLDKAIDIYVTDDDLLPHASTCGLNFYISTNVTKEKLQYSLRECVGFGSL